MRGYEEYTKNSTIQCMLQRSARNATKKNGYEIKALAYHNVWLSGFFYRKSELEKYGYSFNFDSLINDMIKYKKYKIKTPEDRSFRVSHLRRTLTDEYKRW